MILTNVFFFFGGGGVRVEVNEYANFLFNNSLLFVKFTS